MLVKCYGGCEGKYEKSMMVKLKGQNHCPNCRDKVKNEQEDRQLLYNTIIKIFEVPFPTGMMLRQIKQFSEERSYTYKGMTMTLCYIKKVLRKDLNKKGGLALVPYCYDQALQYYKDLEEKRKNTVDVSNEVIKVKISPFKHTTEKIKDRAFIKMGGLV